VAAGALMKYKITISEQARRELRQLPKELRRNIGCRIEVMSEVCEVTSRSLKISQTVIDSGLDLIASCSC
jgi:mRNA-degrading endonuclease RelE of RelBE toxin-antitoxin system